MLIKNFFNGTDAKKYILELMEDHHFFHIRNFVIKTWNAKHDKLNHF